MIATLLTLFIVGLIVLAVIGVVMAGTQFGMASLGTYPAYFRRLAEVMECHMVAGGFDYLLKVRVGDMAAYRSFLGDTLVSMPGVRETRTYAVLETVKLTTQLPI